ncbi:MAG: methyltransferase domain-containing protein [Flavobacteriaceae bacterium]
MQIDKHFWKEKYDLHNIGWDVGEITTPIKEYIDQLNDKNIKILIPGAGNSYEAAYLHKQGFKNVYVIDLVQIPLDNLLKRVPTFPKEHIIKGDFFELNLKFDLVIEQTFFCALPPTLRVKYVDKMNTILKKNGKIAGLLFQFPLTEKGPPFGGSKQEYESIFSKLFSLKTINTAYNSIKPRKDNELFIIFEKK